MSRVCSVLQRGSIALLKPRNMGSFFMNSPINSNLQDSCLTVGTLRNLKETPIY